MEDRPFIPQLQPIDLERSIVLNCKTSENHTKYIKITDLKIGHLPENWRNKKVLGDLKVLARRVVHLRVTTPSPNRRSEDNTGHNGSGFITFDPIHGALINTSKHVVIDPFEAENTIVTLFYDSDAYDIDLMEAENKMILYKTRTDHEMSDISSATALDNTNQTFFSYWGSGDHFRSVLCTDFTVFSCKKLPVNTLFRKEEIERSNAAFSWWKFSFKRLFFSGPMDFDVAIISHPHGWPKCVSFGKMNRPYNMSTSVYTAKTCEGSSGAPMVRFHSGSVHYITAGQFVHHGFCKQDLNKGMATVRPPILFPYWRRFDSNHILSSAICILYEPIIYWTLVFSDFLYIESTLNSTQDVFAYTASICAILFTVDSLPFKILSSGYLIHKLVTAIKDTNRSNLRLAICDAISSFIGTSMFLIAWGLLHISPRTFPYTLLAIMVWLIVLFLERYFSLSWRFRNKYIGSFGMRVLYNLEITGGKKNLAVATGKKRRKKIKEV